MVRNGSQREEIGLWRGRSNPADTDPRYRLVQARARTFGRNFRADPFV